MFFWKKRPKNYKKPDQQQNQNLAEYEKSEIEIPPSSRAMKFTLYTFRVLPQSTNSAN